MNTEGAVKALSALAQENRLEVFRLLVRAGPEGMPAGEIAEELGLSPNNLSFHLDKLRAAELVFVRREGRFMIYTTRYESMNALLEYLTENCCTRSERRTRPVYRLPSMSRFTGIEK